MQINSYFSGAGLFDIGLMEAGLQINLAGEMISLLQYFAINGGRL